MENNDNASEVVLDSRNNQTVYREDDRILILFINVTEDGRFSVCKAVGDLSKNPMGESFDEMIVVDTLEEAKLIHASMNNLAELMLGPGETDRVVRPFQAK